MEQIEDGASFVRGIDPAGAMDTFANGTFTSTLTHVTDMTLTSVATGTVSQTTEGYALQCYDPVEGSIDAEVHVLTSGKLLLETNTS